VVVDTPGVDLEAADRPLEEHPASTTALDAKSARTTALRLEFIPGLPLPLPNVV